MNYNVLLFDDRPQIRVTLMEHLQEIGMTVLSCKNVFEADDMWEAKKDEIHAIVLDMMMPSIGLPRDLEFDEVNTGWVWLWYHLNLEKDLYKAIKNKCFILFSAYLKDFKEYLDRLPQDEPEWQLARTNENVHLIEKGEKDNFVKILQFLEEHRKSLNLDKQ